MFGFRNNYSASGKKKRLPVFSVLLVTCYLIAMILFFVFAFGDEKDRTGSGDEPVIETTPPPPETAEPEPEPIIFEPIPLPPPVEVKGIWVGAWFIVEPGRLERYIELCETTEINTIVIDIKEEHGYVTIPMEREGFPVNDNILLENMGEIVEDLKSRDIYTIARIVCFKDPRWVARNPHLALRDGDGNRWTDRGGISWLNPYERENWEYIAEICLRAAELGFQEIQLDYVRFPADGNLGDIYFGEAGDEFTKAEIIAEFMKFIRDTMLKVGVRTSADVFGVIGLSNNDAQIIGQDLDLLLPILHYISPMIYPSHFANINQNGQGQFINGILFETPDTEPHAVIYNTLQHFIRRHESSDANTAIIRPFLQDFTAGYLGEGMFIPYGPEEIRAQIQAVYDAGLTQWLLWSNVSRYTTEAFTDPQPDADSVQDTDTDSSADGRPAVNPNP